MRAEAATDSFFPIGVLSATPESMIPTFTLACSVVSAADGALKSISAPMRFGPRLFPQERSKVVPSKWLVLNVENIPPKW